MIEVRVPEEIEDYKEKIIMGMSIRQLISVGIALLCGVPTFLILNKFINGDVATYATMLVVVPAFCVGFFKKDGYNFEIFLKVRLYAFFSKSQRGYATNPEESELPIEAEKYRPLIQQYIEKEKQEKAANLQNRKIDLKGVIISFVRNVKNSENKSKNRKTKKAARREYDLVEVTEKSIKRRRKEAARSLKASAGKHRKKKSKKKKQLKAEAAPRSCQDTLHYKYMFQNGICQIGDNFFSLTIKISDINYQVAQREDQIDIFSRYCEILNYFDPKVNVQITVHNRRIDMAEFKRQMLLKLQNDDKDDLRQEYNKMLEDKTLQGQNSIIREKYVTFGIEADCYEAAYPTLMRIETDVTSRFKSLGCDVSELSGQQRLSMMNSILNPNEPLVFDYDMLVDTGLSTKDFICPYFFDFRLDNKQINFEFGDYYGQVLMIKKYPTDMGDALLNELSEIPCNTTISIHTNSTDNSDALEHVKMKLAFMEQDKMNRQQKLIQQMADPDMIPQNLKRNLEKANELINDMQNNNQRIFKGSVLVFTSAKTLKELNENVEKLKGVARSNSCELMPVACEQEKGLNATLPLGRNDIPIRRTLTTASQAIFIPFTTQELFDEGGMYYGLNALSRNLIFFNRKALKNPAGFVLGTPGSGKSFSVKRELVNILLSSSEDEVLVIDPESEYGILAENFGGEVIRLANDTDTFFNPLDITMDYSSASDKDEEEESADEVQTNPLSFKTEFLFSFLDVIVTKESGNGLSGAERTLVDRTLTSLYQKYFANPGAAMPTLVDFCKELQSVKAPELQGEKNNLLKVLGLYTEGSFNLFAHRTNININNKFVVFDIKELGDQIKTMGMLVILDQIWNRVTSNRLIGRRTWIVVDEAHLLFSNPFSAQFLSSLWKRARKYGGICTGITQNVEDLLESDLARKMLSNSDYILMLNQATSDRVKLGELLNISQNQLGFVTNANSGQGLLFAGNSIIPFIDKFPSDTKLYKMMTTKPDEQENR